MLATGISCPFNGNPGSRPRARGGQRGGGGAGARELLKTSEPFFLLLPARQGCSKGPQPHVLWVSVQTIPPSAGGAAEAGPPWACLSKPACGRDSRVPLHSQTRPSWTWSLPQTTCPVNHTHPAGGAQLLYRDSGCWHPGQTPGREEALGHSSHRGRTRLLCGPLGTGPVEPTAATPVLQQCHLHVSPQHAS